jgi:hypothetical protein
MCGQVLVEVSSFTVGSWEGVRMDDMGAVTPTISSRVRRVAFHCVGDTSQPGNRHDSLYSESETKKFFLST